MLNYVIKRLLGLIPTLLIVAVLVFLFVHMLPGDPARLIAGPEADAQVVGMVRQQLGLDRPLHVRFIEYMPEDQVEGRSRYAGNVRHDHNFGGGWSGNVNFSGVSDPRYFIDLSTRLALTSQVNLLRQGALSYSGGG